MRLMPPPSCAPIAASAARSRAIRSATTHPAALAPVAVITYLIITMMHATASPRRGVPYGKPLAVVRPALQRRVTLRGHSPPSHRLQRHQGLRQHLAAVDDDGLACDV